jgi:hypothetical protein
MKVLDDVDFSMVAGLLYDSSVDRTNVGNISVIENSLVDLGILLADALEAGKNMDEATLLVNKHRQEDGS